MPTLSDKLHPKRFPTCPAGWQRSSDTSWARSGPSPVIAELVITSDGWVLARDEGQVTFDTIVGTAADLERNWLHLLERRD